MSEWSLMYPFLSAIFGLFIIAIWVTFGSRILGKLIALKGFQIAEADSKPWMLAFVLLALFNSNQIVGAQLPFFVLVFFSPVILVFSWITFSSQLIRRAVIELLEILLVGFIALIAVTALYHAGRYWVHEGPNHDSLVYFEGLMWALDKPLLVGGEAVKSHWGFNTCGNGGSIWIGFDCGLYRGGTYTLSAWIQFFSPYKTGNGLYSLLAYAGLFSWIAVGELVGKINLDGTRNFVLRLFFPLLLLFSTAVLSSLIDSNLATMLAAASLAILVAILSNRTTSILRRCILGGLWASVGAHFYAESIFYAGLIVFIAVIVEYFQERKTSVFRKNIFSLFCFGMVLLVAMNYVTVYAVQSLFLFKSISQGGDWPAWYIDAAPWAWLGGFISSPLLGGSEISSYPLAALGASLSIFSIFVLALSRKNHPVIISVLLTSALAVWYVEAKSYRYGEHKILQLLGVSWSLLLALAIIELQSHRPLQILKKKMAVSMYSVITFIIIGVTAYVIGDFITRGARMMKSLEPAHGIHPGIEKLVSHIRPGAVVLLDDTAWLGIEKFHKAHYLTFLIHNQGARVVMSNHGEDVLRGGYFKNELNNTFLSSPDEVRWFVSGQSTLDRTSIFHQTDVEPIAATKDYSLYRILPRLSALVVPGAGFNQCEATHCWTSGATVMEVFSANSGKQKELTIETEYFMPPKDGRVLVTVNGKNLPSIAAGTPVITIPIEAGASKIQLSPSWEPVSPQQLGLSSDSRKLFLMLKNVRVMTSERFFEPVNR